jgi:hypothetical protein
MTARESLIYTDNMPKVPAKLYEGTITRADAMKNGLVITDAETYSLPIVKGDLVRIRTHSVQGQFLVEKAIAANDSDWAIGICVDTPIGGDGITVSGQTPAAAQRRTATIALFGDGVIELTVSQTGVIAPGDTVALDEDESNQVETDVLYASTGTAANGGMVALTYAATNTIVALLVGAACAFVAD